MTVPAPDKISFSAIHAAADARGGSPSDQACASVAEYMRQKQLRVQLALSCIDTGMANIARGRIDLGAAGVRAGFQSLRIATAGARS